MKRIKRCLHRTSPALAGLLLVSMQTACGDNAPERETAPTTLWDELNADTSATFPRLAKAAGLRPDLEQTARPMTAFVPQDRVFDVLPAGLLERLERPEYQTALTLIVKHHVVPQAISQDSVATVATVQTLAQMTLQLGVRLGDDGDLVGDRAAIAGYGFPIGNGELHYVDALLLPSMVDVLDRYSDSAASFAKFSRIVRASGWDPLSAGSPVTLFAPRDVAFASYSPAALDALVADPQSALRFVQAHVASGAVGLFAELPASIATGAGTLTIAQDTLRVVTSTAREVQVLLTDIPTHHGIVHVVDSVLAP